MKYPFSRFPVFLFSCLLSLSFAATLLIPQTSAFDVIDIPDPHLKKAILEILDLPDEIPLNRQEMLRIRRLRIESSELKDLTGLEYATNLAELSLGYVGMVSDLTPISNLISLTKLDVAGNQISDIRPLTGLINLRTLNLSNNPCEDLTPLANLAGLGALTLTHTQVSNLNPLAGLTRLTHLTLRKNRITDLNPLAHLTALEVLRLNSNEITDITPLLNLTALEVLRLDKNAIVDITPLTNLTALRTLWLDRNRITNITPLANLTALDFLRLNSNEISDITPLAGLKNLKEVHIANNPIHDFTPLLQLEGVALDIEIDLTQLDKLNVIVKVPDPNLKQAIQDALSLPDGVPLTQFQMLRLTRLRSESQELKDLTGLEYATNLEDLSLLSSMILDWTPLSNLTSLTELEVVGNQISDIRPLANLINLTELSLRNNQLRDIAPLAHLTALEVLRLNSNEITDITPLLNLTALEVLRLDKNAIVDITPLTNLTALRTLWLDRNRITNITPLANLTALDFLRLNSNEISDITPLAGLKNLKEVHIANNPIHDFTPLLQLEGVALDIEIDLTQLDKLNVVVKVPDPNLRQAIRETLFLPNGVPLTQFQMLRLTRLQVEFPPAVKNLTGLEYATNLQDLSLRGLGTVSDLTPLANLTSLQKLDVAGNQISDMRPLANLIHLTRLHLWRNQIQDIAPLANLTNLTYLNLADNQIRDITPLANLTGLTRLTLFDNQVSDTKPLTELIGLTDLNLRGNHISDFSPLANLVKLEKLFISDNFGTDIGPLRGLNLIAFGYDVICDIPPYIPGTTERIESRSFPSAISLWDGLKGLEHKTNDERATLHDLSINSYPGLAALRSESEPTYGLSTRLGGHVEYAQETHRRWHQLNPNLVFLPSVSWYATGSIGRFSPESEFWLRDENGEIVRNEKSANEIEYQYNLFHPGFQDLIVEKIVAIANCGLYDGIMFDGFSGNATGFVGRNYHPQSGEEIIALMTSILSRIRARVHDDFLILANGNRSKLTAYTEYINGTFMETGYDYGLEYTHGGLAQIERTLLWSEENLRDPRINCLEGEGIGSEAPDSPANKQRMRLFTALSLTHSNGYVLYNMGAGYYGGSEHAHIWHDFWDADLGQPVGPKAQRYKAIPGLFIREFTNGWAVYNRSGKAQTISLPESVTGVSSGKSGVTHILPDLDGEMYLKGKNPADVNGDGKVNVLDLVQVANGFGKSTPDPNGDGAVNILDLVFVAQQFSQ